MCAYIYSKSFSAQRPLIKSNLWRRERGGREREGGRERATAAICLFILPFARYLIDVLCRFSMVREYLMINVELMRGNALIKWGNSWYIHIYIVCVFVWNANTIRRNKIQTDSEKQKQGREERMMKMRDLKWKYKLTLKRLRNTVENKNKNI